MPGHKGKQSGFKLDKDLNFRVDKLQFFNEQEKKISAALVAADQELRRKFFPGRVFRAAAPAVAQEIYNGYQSNIENFTNHLLLLCMAIYLLSEKYNTPTINWPEKIGAILQSFLENDVIKLEEDPSIKFLGRNNSIFSTRPYFLLMFASLIVSFCLNLFAFLKALERYGKDKTGLMPKAQGFVAVAGFFNLFMNGMARHNHLLDDMNDCLSAQEAEIIEKLYALMDVIGENKAEIMRGKDEGRLFGYIKIFLKKKASINYSAGNIGHRKPSDHDVNKEILFVLRLLGIYGYEIKEEGRIGIKLFGAIGQKKSSLTIEEIKEILHQRLVFRQNRNFYQERDPHFSDLKEKLYNITSTFWYIDGANRDNKEMLCLSTANFSEDVKAAFKKIADRCPDIVLEENSKDKADEIYCVDIARFSAEISSYLRAKERQRKSKDSVSLFTPMREWEVSSSSSSMPIAKKQGKKEQDNMPVKSSNMSAKELSEKAEMKQPCAFLPFIGLDNMERDVNDSMAFRKITQLLAKRKMLAPNSRSQQGLKCTLDKKRLRVKMKGYGGGLRPLFIFNSEKSQEHGENIYEYKGLMHK